MVFNSIDFALFFVAVLLVLPWLSWRASNIFLLLASCWFYAVWDWRFLGLLLGSSLVNYYLVQWMHRSDGPENRRMLLGGVIVFNLIVLGFFKYYNFFAVNFNRLLETVGIGGAMPTLQIILPLAISFFTFHCLSYAIDVYRGDAKPAGRWPDFFLYLTLFPHLVAGPIVRASQLLPQIAKARKVDLEDWREGLFLIFWGLAKKVVVADNLAPKSERLFALTTAGGGEVFLGVLAFTFQIYADFSGYTDMARGCARLMGFHFDLNFRTPYFATNPQDFWRRWHISLSQWLRDYVYIPLGGGRLGVRKTYRNLMLTMLIGGLWHGAAWNFVLWGGYHGTLLCLHRLIRGPGVRKDTDGGAGWRKGFSMALMFMFTMYGWLLFRAVSIEQIATFSAALVTPSGWLPEDFLTELFRLSVYIIPMMVFEGLMALRGKTVLAVKRDWVNGLVCCVLFYYTVLMGNHGGRSFIYFNF